MRKRLEHLIALVVLAVVVQLFAPIAAFRVVAYAASDPLYLESTCSGFASGDQQAPTSKTSHSPAKCCGFCSISHGAGTAVAPPSAIFVSIQRHYQLLSWLEAADPIQLARIGSNTQARAPPAIS